jgi:hypothetical protein
MAREVQPKASRVSLISSAPKGSPCALEVLARLGLPLPMAVLQTIKVGLSALFLASQWLCLQQQRHGRRLHQSRSSRKRQNAEVCCQ